MLCGPGRGPGSCPDAGDGAATDASSALSITWAAALVLSSVCFKEQAPDTERHETRNDIGRFEVTRDRARVTSARRGHVHSGPVRAGNDRDFLVQVGVLLDATAEYVVCYSPKTLPNGNAKSAGQSSAIPSSSCCMSGTRSSAVLTPCTRCRARRK